MFRYFNTRDRSSVARAAYLYGSTLQETGAGPFTLPTDTNDIFPQWWAYVGTDPVVLTLAAIPTFGIGVREWLLAVRNNGTGGATVDVMDDATATLLVSLAEDEAALIGWDSALLRWQLIGTWSVAASSTFVNPMANNTYLSGEDTGATPRVLLGVTASDRAVLGDGVLPVDALQIVEQLPVVAVASADILATYADRVIAITMVAATPRTVTLPAVTAADVGRTITICNVGTVSPSPITVAATGTDVIFGVTSVAAASGSRTYIAVIAQGTGVAGWVSG